MEPHTNVDKLKTEDDKYKDKHELKKARDEALAKLGLSGRRSRQGNEKDAPPPKLVVSRSKKEATSPKKPVAEAAGAKKSAAKASIAQKAHPKTPTKKGKQNVAAVAKTEKAASVAKTEKKQDKQKRPTSVAQAEAEDEEEEESLPPTKKKKSSGVDYHALLLQARLEAADKNWSDDSSSSC